MAHGFNDACHDHVIEAFAKRGYFFHFQADGGQHRAQLIARGGGRDVAAQPVFGEFHGVTLVGGVPPVAVFGVAQRMRKQASIQKQPSVARLYTVAAYANCFRNRTSFSKNARRSLTP